MISDYISNNPTIRFYNADCMKLMAQVPDNYYDLAIVDPPYGINFAKQHTGKGWIVRESKDWDKEIPPKEYFDELYRVSKNQIIFGANYMVEHLKPSQGWVFWDKGQRDFSLADGELIYTSFDRALRVVTITRGYMQAEMGGVKKWHPTTKPIKLYRWLLQKFAKQGDKILDTHGGSMSIAIACDMEGFELDICERDTEYFNTAIERFKKYKQQLTLF